MLEKIKSLWIWISSTIDLITWSNGSTWLPAKPEYRAECFSLSGKEVFYDPPSCFSISRYPLQTNQHEDQRCSRDFRERMCNTAFLLYTLDQILYLFRKWFQSHNDNYDLKIIAFWTQKHWFCKCFPKVARHVIFQNGWSQSTRVSMLTRDKENCIESRNTN